MPRAVVVVLVAPEVEPAGHEEEGAPEHGGHDTEEGVEEGNELGEHVGGYPGQEVDRDPHGPQDPLVVEVPPPRLAEEVEQEHFARHLGAAAASHEDGGQTQAVGDLDHDGR